MILQLAAVYKEAESKISTEPALLLVAAISHADAVAAEPHAQPLLSGLLDQCSSKVCALLRRVKCYPVAGIADVEHQQTQTSALLHQLRLSGFGAVVPANSLQAILHEDLPVACIVSLHLRFVALSGSSQPAALLVFQGSNCYRIVCTTCFACRWCCLVPGFSSQSELAGAQQGSFHALSATLHASLPCCLLAQSAPVRAAAEVAATVVISSLSPYAVDVVLPTLLDAMDLKKLWQTKVAAMTALVALSKQAPDQVKLNLPTIVPVLSGCVCDAKKQVKVKPHPIGPPPARALLLYCPCVAPFLFQSQVRSHERDGHPVPSVLRLFACGARSAVHLNRCECACAGLTSRPSPCVQAEAISSMSIVCASVGNRDIDPFIPLLISAIATPAEVPDCVHKLSATTFVQVLPPSIPLDPLSLWCNLGRQALLWRNCSVTGPWLLGNATDLGCWAMQPNTMVVGQCKPAPH